MHDGRICLSNNAAERALRGVALGRKVWIFAGSDRGGERAVTEVLEKIPARLKVILHVRPRSACRVCEAVFQAPAPHLPIERGRPGPGLFAHVGVSKYCDGLPVVKRRAVMALAICEVRSAAELRAYARRAPSPRATARAYALTNALEGMTRAEAARLAGMERQALRDAVLRYNAEGLAGLEDRPKSGRPPGLSEGEQAALAAIILRGPDPERDGISAYTREDMARIIKDRFGKCYHPSSLSGLLRRMGFSRQKTRPSHPHTDPAAQARWVKRGSPTP